ncbi:hypothetical protein [Chryseobacterium sp. Marseille-Q3244]|uniref:hypothetical protein n=1 Tax=Chryseobacterium sp. Marseille-Q3244 TaxID=2758092 RepID=UPI0020258601|nr:hypothetical protein [Chryseobacterium sp. Marseille-Q3244]
MVNYDESDLIYNDYVETTTDGDDPNYTAIRDRERVSKNELYELVWFCDAYVKNNDVPKTKASFQKVEKLLRLPQVSHVVMRDELNSFVTKHWNSNLV